MQALSDECVSTCVQWSLIRFPAAEDWWSGLSPSFMDPNYKPDALTIVVLKPPTKHPGIYDSPKIPKEINSLSLCVCVREREEAEAIARVIVPGIQQSLVK